MFIRHQSRAHVCVCGRSCVILCPAEGISGTQDTRTIRVSRCSGGRPSDRRKSLRNDQSAFSYRSDVCVCVSARRHMPWGVCPSVRLCIRTYVNVYLHACIHTYTQIYTYTHTCINTAIHTYIRTANIKSGVASPNLGWKDHALLSLTEAHLQATRTYLGRKR